MGANYIALVSVLLFSVSLNQVTSNPISSHSFTHCMVHAKVNQANIIYPNSPNFYNLFVNAQQNFRHLNNTKRPIAIVTPSNEAETQAAVVCAKKNGLLCRPKSGGHDYENQSFEANEPYIMMDMVNQREITLNMTEETAWVQTGTTLGELYVKISSTNPLYAFPGGTCPSVGTGGFISGGGMGMLSRKYGLGADNVLDARVINANGEILDRKAMGEDFFWAIRGGGGGNFGVVTAWKLKLVRVTDKVTFFHKKLPMKQFDLPKIMAKYQRIAPYLPNEWVVRVFLTWSSKSEDVACSFNSQFLGPKEEALRQMTERFPEMGLNETDVNDYPWINATLRVASHEPTDPLTVFLNRTDGGKTWNKGKSDYLTEPISEAGIQGLLNKLNTSAYSLLLIFDPSGGKVDEFAADALPYPHRKGTLFNIQYLQFWNNNTEVEAKRSMDFLNDVYAYMEPHVSNNPRGAYVNYKDLALGQNPAVGNAKYSEAKVWGERYFKGNFERLAKVKSMVDPENYFRSAQSIPLYGN